MADCVTLPSHGPSPFDEVMAEFSLKMALDHGHYVPTLLKMTRRQESLKRGNVISLSLGGTLSTFIRFVWTALACMLVVFTGLAKPSQDDMEQRTALNKQTVHRSFELVATAVAAIPESDEMGANKVIFQSNLGFEVTMLINRFSDSYVYLSNARIKSGPHYLKLDGFEVRSEEGNFDNQDFSEKKLVAKPIDQHVVMTLSQFNYVSGSIKDSNADSISLQLFLRNPEIGINAELANEYYEDGYFVPAVFLTSPKVTQVAGGDGHSCALFENSQVKCWGQGRQGQLGSEDTLSLGDESGEMDSNLKSVDLGGEKVSQLVAGSNHNCALFENGKVKCWGLNGRGQLGLGHTKNWGDAPNEMGENLAFVDLGDHKILQIDAGGFHTCALTDEGKVLCWGYNRRGQLGQGHQLDLGDNPNEMGQSLSVINLGSGIKVSKVVAGRSHSCALFEKGKIKCWGWRPVLGLAAKDDQGDQPNEMGDDLEFVELGAVPAVDIATGSSSTCALLQNNKVKCWGLNFNGTLGLEDVEHRGDDPDEMGENLPSLDFGTNADIKNIVMGGSRSCVVFDSGSVKCWGRNLSGELGIGHSDNLGISSNQMGAYLPYLDLGEEMVSSLAVGREHGCAIKSSGRIKCWGMNRSGQLGQGHIVDKGKKPNDMGQSLDFTKLGQGFAF